MRVYELAWPGEPPYAFEVDSGWSAFRFTLGRLLQSVPGVTDVRRGGNWFSSDENRAYFLFHGVPFVVWEPFGDNSRYWIGPADTGVPPQNIGPLMQAFRDY
jgi:hypothetical protein